METFMSNRQITYLSKRSQPALENAHLGSSQITWAALLAEGRSSAPNIESPPFGREPNACSRVVCASS
jgi:hypothetical protein